VDNTIRIAIDRGELPIIEWPDKVVLVQNQTRGNVSRTEASRTYIMQKETIGSVTLNPEGTIGHTECVNCKKIIECDSNFCNYCGSKIVGYKFPSNGTIRYVSKTSNRTMKYAAKNESTSHT